MRLIVAACLLVSVLGQLTPGLHAQDLPVRSGFWGGVDFGLGLLEQSFDASEEKDSTLYMGLKGGYTFNSHFSLGLELSGWLLEASNLEDSQKGKGLSQVLLISRFYPLKKTNLFVRLGGGYVNLWSNRPGEPSNNAGLGFTVGGGYDIVITRSFGLSPFASFNFGNADDLDYTAINIGIGFILF